MSDETPGSSAASEYATVLALLAVGLDHDEHAEPVGSSAGETFADLEVAAVGVDDQLVAFLSRGDSCSGTAMQSPSTEREAQGFKWGISCFSTIEPQRG